VAAPRVRHREDQDIGAGPEGVARVAAVRAAVGDGMGSGWISNESLRLADRMAFIRRSKPYALTLVEQPTRADDLAGLAEIAGPSASPSWPTRA